MAFNSSAPKPFKINLSQDTLDWITSRIQTARIIPDLHHPEGKEWSYGIPSSVISPIVEHWKTKYDWREVETRINAKFNMFTIEIEVEEAGETINLHFVHHRSKRADAVPLLFAHGWPGSFLEVESLLEPLTDPNDLSLPAFHIIAPSIPGFSFSSSPTKPGFSIARIASLYHKLMLALGYNHYLCQGGDWGSLIIRAMALNYPFSCVGIHLNFIVSLPPSPIKHPLAILWLFLRWFTPDEKKRLGRLQWWFKEEFGYSQIQGTKPQTISYALQDSPIGMLAWIREKLSTLSEPDYIWDSETVITWTMMYVLTGTAANASIYKEGNLTLKEEVMDKVIGRDVAVGVSSFPKDIGYVPRWWAEVSIGENIVFWKEHEKGGHFASTECGTALVEDIRNFTKVIKASGKRWGNLIEAGKYPDNHSDLNQNLVHL